MDMSMSELQELVMDREAWRAGIHGATKSRTEWLMMLNIFSWAYLPFASLLFPAIRKASSDNQFAFWHFFFIEIVLVTTFCSVQLLSCVQLIVTPWTAVHQAAAHMSFTNAWSLLKLMSIDFVMSSNHLILCHPLLLQPSIFP